MCTGQVSTLFFDYVCLHLLQLQPPPFLPILLAPLFMIFFFFFPFFIFFPVSFYIFCCCPQGTLCFHPAGIVRGSAGGACINDFPLFHCNLSEVVVTLTGHYR